MADSARSLEDPRGGRRRDRGKYEHDQDLLERGVCPKCRNPVSKKSLKRHYGTCKGPF